MKVEFRNIELRASDSEQFVLVGRAVSYGTTSSNELAPGLRERIMPGCFRGSIDSGEDVKALLNHDSRTLPLGRVANGTLMLKDSQTGLDIRVQLDKTNSLHRDVFASVRRGDVSEMSFAFICQDEDVSTGTYNGKACQIRNVRKAKLCDVSVVTAPFYGADATSVSARNAAKANDALLARALAMPGDWEREEKARAIGFIIDADRRAGHIS